jgi:hypothetical protein
MLLVAGCGDSSEPDPAQLSVGGTYQTAVTLESNTCGDVTVQPAPTTVTHAPGASTLSLAHAGNSYSGTVQSNGSFATTPLVVTQSTSSFTTSILGQFSTSGFEAQVTVQVQQQIQPSSCQYVVRWVGTRTSGTNVIPG